MYAAKRYRSNEASTASRGTLLVMLYDGIGKFIRQADLAIESGDFPAGKVSVGRALDIIGYLQATLNESVDSEMVDALDKMYLAWTVVLVRASTRNDATKLQVVLKQVEDMREAWAAVKAETEGGGA